MTGIVKGEHHGFEITGNVYSDGSIGWTSELIGKKDAKYGWEKEEFPSYLELIRAIDAYELSMRKDFTNKTAYYVHRGWRNDEGSVEEVEVTSITPDGKEAWVKMKEGRRKHAIQSLYADKTACVLYLKYSKDTTARYERDMAALQTALDETRWTPKREA